MKKRFMQHKIWLLVCLLTLLVLACQQDEYTDNSKTSLSPEIKATKAWFEQSADARRLSGTTPTRQGVGGGVEGYPLWDQAWVGQDGVVEVPLLLTVRKAYSHSEQTPEAELNAQITRLLVLQNEHGEPFSVLMHLMGDPDYLDQVAYNLQPNRYKDVMQGFTGSVLYTYLDGTFCNGWLYQNGAVTATVDLSRAEGTPAQSGAVRSGIGCRTLFTVETTTYCTVTTTHDPVHVDCHSVLTGLVIWEVCAYATDLNPLTNDGGGGWLWPGNNPNSDDDNSSDNEKPKDPCENIRNMENNAILNDKLKEFMEYAKNEPSEYSFSKANEDGHEAVIRHLPGETYFYTEPNKTYSIFIHSHDLRENEQRSGGAIFSYDDIITLFNFLNEGKINTADLSNFHYLIAGGQGYYGGLNITDVSKFRNFIEGYESTIFLKMDIIHLLNTTSTDEQLGNEFAKFLNKKDAGLTYMRATEAENLKWVFKDVKPNGTVENMNCD